MCERATDLENGEGAGAQPLGRRLDHRGHQKTLDIPLDQDCGIREEEVAMGELQIPLQELAGCLLTFG